MLLRTDTLNDRKSDELSSLGEANNNPLQNPTRVIKGDINYNNANYRHSVWLKSSFRLNLIHEI